MIEGLANEGKGGSMEETMYKFSPYSKIEISFSVTLCLQPLEEVSISVVESQPSLKRPKQRPDVQFIGGIIQICCMVTIYTKNFFHQTNLIESILFLKKHKKVSQFTKFLSFLGMVTNKQIQLLP